MVTLKELKKNGLELSEIIEDISYAAAIYDVVDDDLSVDDIANHEFTKDYSKFSLDGETSNFTLVFTDVRKQDDENRRFCEIEIDDFSDLCEEYEYNEINEFIEYLLKNY